MLNSESGTGVSEQEQEKTEAVDIGVTTMARAVLEYLVHQIYDIVTVQKDELININLFNEEKPLCQGTFHKALPNPITFNWFAIAAYPMRPDLPADTLEALWSSQLHIFIDRKLYFEAIVRTVWCKQSDVCIETSPLHIASGCEMLGKIVGKKAPPTEATLLVVMHGILGRPVA